MHVARTTVERGSWFGSTAHRQRRKPTSAMAVASRCGLSGSAASKRASKVAKDASGRRHECGLRDLARFCEKVAENEAGSGCFRYGTVRNCGKMGLVCHYIIAWNIAENMEMLVKALDVACAAENGLLWGRVSVCSTRRVSTAAALSSTSHTFSLVTCYDCYLLLCLAPY